MCEKIANVMFDVKISGEYNEMGSVLVKEEQGCKYVKKFFQVMKGF